MIDARETIEFKIGKRRMRADEQERRQRSQLSTRIGSSFESNDSKPSEDQKPSIWQRLSLNRFSQSSGPGHLTRTVNFNDSRHNVFSRLGVKKAKNKMPNRF